MGKYTAIIGMEVHAQLSTDSKMFCSCKNEPDLKEANIHICEVCLAHPGTLPVPNKKAIEHVVKLGKALNCSIRDISKFDRKNYFYPDLPKGYQISQYDEPIAEDGKLHLTFELEDNNRESAVIGIERAHLEEDTAKLMHNTNESTLVDFNRSGSPLVEIVTMPDFQSAIEAKVYCQELQLLLRYLNVSHAEMDKGHMRCEANISVQESGSFDIVNGKVVPKEGYTLNNKVELKNLNSFKAVERGIDFEIKRQTAMIENNETWPQQTRGWNEQTEETVMQRIKENAADYRYFPEPDIPPFSPKEIASTISLPELPQAKRKRFHSEYGFSYADAKQLTDDISWANLTEEIMSELIEWLYTQPEVKGSTLKIKEEKQQKIVRLTSDWITSKLVQELRERSWTLEDLKISPENIAELISLVYTKKINSGNAQRLLKDMLDKKINVDPSHIMEEKGYGQVRDEDALSAVVDEVIRSNPKQVEEFKSGKDPIIKFLIGMAMKATEGTADPVIIGKILREKLS